MPETGEIPIPQPKPEVQKPIETPKNFTELPQETQLPESSTPLPKKIVEIPAIQNFLEVGLDIQPENLTPALKSQYDELVRVIEEKQEMSDEEYVGKFTDFQKNLRQSEELNLTKEQEEKLDGIDKSIESGTFTQDHVVRFMKGFVEDPAHGLTGQEREVVLASIQALKDQIIEPKNKQDQKKVKEHMSKIFSILKMGGFGLVAFLLMSIFKAAKSVSGGESGQMSH